MDVRRRPLCRGAIKIAVRVLAGSGSIRRPNTQSHRTKATFDEAPYGTNAQGYPRSSRTGLLALRVNLALAPEPRVSHRAEVGGADALGEFPQGPGAVVGDARLPVALAVLQLDRIDFEVDRAGDGVDGDDVAVLDQRDRTAVLGLGADVA